MMIHVRMYTPWLIQGGCQSAGPIRPLCIMYAQRSPQSHHTGTASQTSHSSACALSSPVCPVQDGIMIYMIPLVSCPRESRLSGEWRCRRPYSNHIPSAILVATAGAGSAIGQHSKHACIYLHPLSHAPLCGLDMDVGRYTHWASACGRLTGAHAGRGLVGRGTAAVAFIADPGQYL
jgi:hypothetical protein